jgi:agmatine deiminase
MTVQDPARSPKSLGYRMPAEYAPHKRTWMMWPNRAEVWPDMAATKRDYAAVAQAIAEFEPLCMAVRPEDAAEARVMLGSGIELFEVPLDDSWARDAGPNFVLDAKGNKAASLFTFSAWGHKYASFDKDAAFGPAVAAREGMPMFQSPLLAEGGGVTVDGEGTIITTDTCFLNPNRNPTWTREEVTRELLETLGGDKVIWLPGNADETETDGHVDGIAVFVAPGVVLIEGADDPSDPWRHIKQANIDALRGQTDAKGREIRMVDDPRGRGKLHHRREILPLLRQLLFRQRRRHHAGIRHAKRRHRAGHLPGACSRPTASGASISRTSASAAAASTASPSRSQHDSTSPPRIFRSWRDGPACDVCHGAFRHLAAVGTRGGSGAVDPARAFVQGHRADAGQQSGNGESLSQTHSHQTWACDLGRVVFPHDVPPFAF